MGSRFDVVCKNCGTKYEADEGGGMSFHLLHCDKCGKGKSVYFDELLEDPLNYRAFEDYAGKCECGGNFTHDAPLRCPNCRSTEIESSDLTLLYD